MTAQVDKEKCVAAENAKKVCPVEAIKVENGMAKIRDDCIECGACVVNARQALSAYKRFDWRCVYA